MHLVGGEVDVVAVEDLGNDTSLGGHPPATSAQSFRVIGALTVTPADPSISADASRQFTATGPGSSAAPWRLAPGCT